MKSIQKAAVKLKARLAFLDRLATRRGITFIHFNCMTENTALTAEHVIPAAGGTFVRVGKCGAYKCGACSSGAPVPCEVLSLGYLWTPQKVEKGQTFLYTPPLQEANKRFNTTKLRPKNYIDINIP